MPTPDLNDQVWFVTGASVGFGRDIANEVIARGGRVVATARKRDSVAAIEAANPERALALALDVTQPEQVATAVKAAESRFGRIDVLVNNAGFGFMGGIEETSEAEYRYQFEVNFFGLVAMTRAVLPGMRRRKAGHVVNISSVVGAFGAPGSGYYVSTKFALEGFSESLAQEIAPFGLRVLIVEPGAFRTEFFGRSMMGPANPMPEYEALAKGRRAMAGMDGKQPGDPQKAATAIVDHVAQRRPQLRLILSAGGFQRVRDALQARLDECDSVREIAVSTDFPAGR